MSKVKLVLGAMLFAQCLWADCAELLLEASKDWPEVTLQRVSRADTSGRQRRLFFSRQLVGRHVRLETVDATIIGVLQDVPQLIEGKNGPEVRGAFHLLADARSPERQVTGWKRWFRGNTEAIAFDDIATLRLHPRCCGREHAQNQLEKYADWVVSDLEAHEFAQVPEGHHIEFGLPPLLGRRVVFILDSPTVDEEGPEIIEGQVVQTPYLENGKAGGWWVSGRYKVTVPAGHTVKVDGHRFRELRIAPGEPPPQRAPRRSFDRIDPTQPY